MLENLSTSSFRLLRMAGYHTAEVLSPGREAHGEAKNHDFIESCDASFSRFTGHYVSFYPFMAKSTPLKSSRREGEEESWIDFADGSRRTTAMRNAHHLIRATWQLVGVRVGQGCHR